MIRSRLRRLLLAAGVLAIPMMLHASSPRFWIASTQADLLKGEVDGLSIDEFGRLRLGPVVRPVYDASLPFIWALAPGPDASLYAGTGNDGQVLRVDRSGKATVWFDAPELEVHALAAAPDGSLFVGTSPDGKVYRVTAAGASSVFFDPEDKYIWSLALDSRGRLYVGTGDKGLIYRVSPDGTGAVFHNTRATNVTALTVDRQGRVLAGTDSPGRLLRLDEQGKAFALLDSPYREIRAIRVDAAGRIYAAAVNGKPAPAPPASAGAAEPPRPAATPSVSTEITAITVLDAPTIVGGPPSPGRREEPTTPKGAVFRLDADGAAEVIWESSEDIPFDLDLEETGAVLVSTGSSGKLYRVEGSPPSTALVARLAGKQATAMAVVGGARFVATSNPARIVAVGPAMAKEGSYLSETRDAGTVATWGTLSWKAVPDADGRVQIFTRSGNTATPDEAWSAWEGPYKNADGEAIRSPAARYLQWKVVVSAGTGRTPPPIVAAVSVAYLQRNLRPRVDDIVVHPPGVVFQRPYPTGEPEIAGLDASRPEYRFPVFSMPLGTAMPGGATPPLGRRLYQKGLRAFAWQARDDNDDRLVYDVHFRRVEDADWRPLRLDVQDSLIVWDTTSVADGSYVLRVTASDRQSNPPALALSGQRQTAAFDIDNTPPAIAVRQVTTSGTATVVVFETHDAHSAIERVEYSVDAGPWQATYPADGAADGRRERFEIRVEGPLAGRVVVRATDAMNNTGTARLEPPPSPAK